MDQRRIHSARPCAATWRSRDPKLKEKVIDVILALPDILVRSHQHTGFGSRRPQGSDYPEVRLDLLGRLILRVGPMDVVLFEGMNSRPGAPALTIEK
jgi:hypothetical protein